MEEIRLRRIVVEVAMSELPLVAISQDVRLKPQPQPGGSRQGPFVSWILFTSGVRGTSRRWVSWNQG